MTRKETSLQTMKLLCITCVLQKLQWKFGKFELFTKISFKVKIIRIIYIRVRF